MARIEAMESARVIDRIVGEEPGPTLILVGGIHGNEPAGVDEARSVLGALRAFETPVRGEIIALAGNVRGLAAEARYLVRDLNRMWTSEKIAAARATPDRQAETAEVVELADALDAVIARARGPVYALDLHTTSAAGVPFSVVGATSVRRTFARNFHIPGLVGLEEALEGVLTTYLSTKGCVAMAVEGGQHKSPDAAESLAAVITVALAVSGVADAADLPELADAEAHLTRARGDLPPLIGVVSRYAVEPALGFQMEPGFANIQPIVRGTLIAREGKGEIRAPFDGLVLLPLYQAQGSDGFFYGRALAD
jgi:predicted deacylase